MCSRKWGEGTYARPKAIKKYPLLYGVFCTFPLWHIPKLFYFMEGRLHFNSRSNYASFYASIPASFLARFSVILRRDYTGGKFIFDCIEMLFVHGVPMNLKLMNM